MPFVKLVWFLFGFDMQQLNYVDVVVAALFMGGASL